MAHEMARVVEATGRAAGDARDRYQPADGSAEVCSTGFVSHTHRTGPTDHVLCVTACECGKPSILPILFNDGAPVTLTLEAPDPGTDRGSTDEHPRIDVHLNPGPEHDHNPCLTFDTCGECFADTFEAVLAGGAARIGVHLDPTNVAVAPVRVADRSAALAALRTVRARHVPTA